MIKYNKVPDFALSLSHHIRILIFGSGNKMTIFYFHFSPVTHHMTSHCKTCVTSSLDRII